MTFDQLSDRILFYGILRGGILCDRMINNLSDYLDLLVRNRFYTCIFTN